jgi:hypothetical protein
MLDSLPPEAGGARLLIDRFVSEEFFSAKAAEDWNALVGTWIDAEFERGAIYELEADVPIPIFPNLSVPYLYRFSFKEKVPCAEGDSDTACVVLEMVSSPDPDALTALLDSIVRGVAGESVAIDLLYRHLEIENYIMLVTEPDGMIPHRLEISQIISGDLDVPGQGRPTFSQQRLRTLVYRYLSNR